MIILLFFKYLLLLYLEYIIADELNIICRKIVGSTEFVDKTIFEKKYPPINANTAYLIVFLENPKY